MRESSKYRIWALLLVGSFFCTATGNNTTGLSLSKYDSILSTEVMREFGPEGEERWIAATSYEWQIAKDVETEGKRRLRARKTQSTTTDELYPFVVCHLEHGKAGIDCKNEIREFFGTSDFIQISNSKHESCFFLSTTASIAENAVYPLVVQPMMPEMKLENIDGVDIPYEVNVMKHQAVMAARTSTSFDASPPEYTDKILFDMDRLPASRFNAMFTPGFTNSHEDANELAHIIMDEIREDFASVGNRRRSRSLVSTRFLRLNDDGSESGHHSSERFGRGLLEGIDNPDGICNEMLDDLSVYTSPQGDTMTIDLAVDSETLRHSYTQECLHSLLAALAVRREFCVIDVSPEKLPMNAVAQWITQSGSDNDRPFFDTGLTGRGQVVAVSDTGLDTNNCYFYDGVGDTPRTNTFLKDFFPEKRKVVQYVRFVDDGDAIKGHGTHVAGTIAGRKYTNGEEVAGSGDGIARDAKIAFFDIGNSYQAITIPASPEALIQPGVAAGAKIHSASWGSFYNSYGVEEARLDKYLIDNEDILFVVAAGNSGKSPWWTNRGTIGAPATAKNVLTVGASESEGIDNQGLYGQDYLANFSSRGPTGDGRIKPEIVAPGKNIRSAASGSGCETFTLAGTSMATPVVSGTAALIRQYFEEGFFPTGSKNGEDSRIPSASLVKAVLINGAVPLRGAARNWWGPESSDMYDANQGFGLINLMTSLPLSGKNSMQAMIIDKEPISNGQTHEYELTISSSSGCSLDELSATLVWSDPPGGPGCRESCLINDLDLTLTKGIGLSEVTYHPNGRTTPDRKNNVERVRVDAESGDNIIVSVTGSNLSSINQKYALIVTGCLADGDNIGSPTPPTPPSPPPPTPPSPPPPTPPSPPPPTPPSPTPPSPTPPSPPPPSPSPPDDDDDDWWCFLFFWIC